MMASRDNAPSPLAFRGGRPTGLAAEKGTDFSELAGGFLAGMRALCRASEQVFDVASIFQGKPLFLNGKTKIN